MSVLTIPLPKADKLFSLPHFCPQGLFVSGCLPLIPVPPLASWLHPHPDQTPTAPRIVSQPPALPPLWDKHFASTEHLSETGRPHRSIRLIFQPSELERGGYT